MGIQINGNTDTISAVDGSLSITGSDLGITTSITVGTSFIRSGSVGLGTVSTTGRNSGVGTAIGTIVYNETTGQVEVYRRNTGWVSIATTSLDASVSATGGNISAASPGNGRIYHIFTSPGTFTVSGGTLNNVEYLVVAGGGGGGEFGGGGAGGYRNGTRSFTASSYTITIGAAGASDSNGSPSSIGSIVVATGGGAGGDGYNPTSTPAPGQSGGSGGGGGYDPGQPPGSDVTSPDGISPTTQGNPGGNGTASNPSFASGGGGGGAGGAGTAAGPGAPGGPGGIGLQAPANIRGYGTLGYGTPGPNPGGYYFAGGGGGYAHPGGTSGTGGSGGGGSSQPGPNNGVSGTVNTGGGGGSQRASGGSGIVIITYPS